MPMPGLAPPSFTELEGDAFNLMTTVLANMGIPILDPDFMSEIERELHQKYLQILLIDLKEHVCVK